MHVPENRSSPDIGFHCEPPGLRARTLNLAPTLRLVGDDFEPTGPTPTALRAQLTPCPTGPAPRPASLKQITIGCHACDTRTIRTGSEMKDRVVTQL